MLGQGEDRCCWLLLVVAVVVGGSSVDGVHVVVVLHRVAFRLFRELGAILCNHPMQAVDRVAWPARLTHLSLGFHFNMPLSGVSWPKSLRTLIFGDRFNQVHTVAVSICGGEPAFACVER